MKNTLYLVGMGICDEKDISLRSIEILKGCGKIFAEQYTNLMKEGTIERLEKLVDKKIVLLGREEVEGEKIILEECENHSVALLVPGDPMTATTHSSLVEGAKKRGIETRILHSSSIFTAAAGAAGLQIYKFGKTPTITYWRKNYEPAAFLDLIKENLERGAHTLCLLDVDKELGPMRVSVAFDILKKAQKKKGVKKRLKKWSLEGKTKIFVLWRVGWEDEKIWAGKISDYKFSGVHEHHGPAVIIIPGKMHFAEDERWAELNGAGK